MSMNKVTLYIKSINIEMIIWPLALIILSTLDPHVEHWSLCPLKNLGFESCPGCGLGRSIGLLFQGEYKASFNAHPLGALAIIILTYRTVYLAILSFKEISSKKSLS